MRSILEASTSIRETYAGPEYYFPDDIASNNLAQRMTRDNAACLKRYFAWMIPQLDVMPPVCAVIVDGQAVSMCFSSRTTPLAGPATSLLAYWLTHGSGPFWQDSGLFLAALKAGGGLLPPGYPVYLILGRPFVAAFQWLWPNRTFAEAGNMFSAIWASRPSHSWLVEATWTLLTSRRRAQPARFTISVMNSVSE